MNRLQVLESRNERLFTLKGQLSALADMDPSQSFSVMSILEMLEEIVNGVEEVKPAHWDPEEVESRCPERKRMQGEWTGLKGSVSRFQR